MAITAKPCGSASGTRSAIAAAIAWSIAPIGEIGQQPGDLLQRHLARQIAQRDRQRETVALPPQAHFQLVPADRQRRRRGGCRAALRESLADFGAGKHRLAQERRDIRGAAQRVAPLRLPVASDPSHAFPLAANSPRRRNFPSHWSFATQMKLERENVAASELTQHGPPGHPSGRSARSCRDHRRAPPRLRGRGAGAVRS